jgi:hypothetical protein
MIGGKATAQSSTNDASRSSLGLCMRPRRGSSGYRPTAVLDPVERPGRGRDLLEAIDVLKEKAEVIVADGHVTAARRLSDRVHDLVGLAFRAVERSRG